MAEATDRVVAIANGNYAKLDPLKRAVSDARDLAAVLEEHRFRSIVLPDLESGELLNAIHKHLKAGTMTDGSLILVWIGHGTIDENHSLRLMARSDDMDIEVGGADDLGKWAARSGARQVLVVVDTCYSGAGLVEAAQLANAVNAGRRSPEKTWFGVIAASLSDQPALSGALVRALNRLLKEGPTKPDFRWDKTHRYIRGDDLLQTLLQEFDEPRQQPYQISLGLAWDLVLNPLYQAGVPDQPVEHLLQAARGSSNDQSFFTGREEALRTIVGWVRRGVQGMFVLTGSPGCGKSAIAGRIVSLSSSSERSRLLAAAPIAIELDPGEGCVDAQLHARGVTIDTAVEDLGRQLGIAEGGGSFDILALAQRRRVADDPLVIVIDGLDEARSSSAQLALELLVPLSNQALVLVATRNVQSEDSNLVAKLGPNATVLDLGEHPEGTQRDVRQYVLRRLEGASPAMNPELVAEEIAKAGSGPGSGTFLLARLITSQLRDAPVDTSQDGWQLRLATTVANALERDLQSVVLDIDGRPHPAAAREMMRALALSHGGGFPADDVWPTVAGAVSGTATTYTREHAYAVLTALSRHIIAGSEGDQPVYRIAHQQLVDYLNHSAVDVPGGVDAAVGAAVLGVYERVLDAGLDPRAHRYLWRYAWLHLANAEPRDLSGLRKLVERDRAAFLPDLAAALQLAATKLWSAGSSKDALRLIDEAVAARRELGDDLKLTMALFVASAWRVAEGDEDGAEAAANEASAVARKLGDRPEGREIVSAALVASGLAQMSDYPRSAKRLFDEAIALIEGGGTTAVEGHWAPLASAYTLSGSTALRSGDVETAVTLCQRAVELVDQYSARERDRLSRIVALTTLAEVQSQQSVQNASGANGVPRRSITTAAERVWREYCEDGRASFSDLGTAVVTAGALVTYFRALMFDALRGLGAPVQSHTHLLDEAIALVSHYAEQNPDAAIILAAALSLRAALPDRDAIADRAEAERLLRPLVDKKFTAVTALAQLLDLEVVHRAPLLLQGRDPDPAQLIARQAEAIALYRRAQGAELQLLGALARLSALLLVVAGKDYRDVPVRADAIETARSLATKIPMAASLLATLLADQAGRQIQRNLVEAVELAREALDLAAKLPSAESAATLAIARFNLASAQMQLGVAPEENRELLQQVVESFDGKDQSSRGNNWGAFERALLGQAKSKLASLEIQDGRFREAAALAEAAAALLDSPEVWNAIGSTRWTAQLVLGRAYAGLGKAEATAILERVVHDIVAAVVAAEIGPGNLAATLNDTAPELWDDALSEVHDHIELHDVLRLMRARPPSELELTVESLVTAKNVNERTLRNIARSHRSRDPNAFDAAWRERTGELPAWLALDAMHEGLVVAWWNALNWKSSRDYLRAHPALLGAMTDVVLDELGFDDAHETEIAQHRKLLDKARTMGADAAYAPLLAELEVLTWVEGDDPERYLMEHSELARPELIEALRANARNGDSRSALCASILELAQRGEQELAFKVFKDPRAALVHLQAALRSTDVIRLNALATILKEATEDPDLLARARTAIAIARILEGRQDDSEASLQASAEGGDDQVREQLVGMVGDAIAHHPLSAGSLARLIEQLSSRTSDFVSKHPNNARSESPS